MLSHRASGTHPGIAQAPISHAAKPPPRSLSELNLTQKQMLQLVTLGGTAAGQPVPDAAVIYGDEGASQSMSAAAKALRRGKDKKKRKEASAAVKPRKQKSCAVGWFAGG